MLQQLKEKEEEKNWFSCECVQSTLSKEILIEFVVKGCQPKYTNDASQSTQF